MKSKHLYQLLFCMFVQLSSTGCSSDNDYIPEELVVENHYININSNVSYKAIVSSRDAITGTTLPKGAEVGLYALKTTWEYGENNQKIVALQSWNENNMQTNFNNEPYVSNGSKVLTSVNGTTAMFPGGSNPALYFYGYYPYSQDVVFDKLSGSAPKIYVKIEETMEKTIDYLYVEPLGTYPTGTYNDIDLQFKHALAIVRLEINSSTGTQGHCPKLKKIHIVTKNNQSGWMNIATGDIVFEEKTSDGIINNTFSYQPDPMFSIYQGGSSDTGAHFMFIPSVNTIDSIILTILDENGKETEQEIYREYQELSNYKTLNKGYVYTIKVDYGKRTDFRYEIIDWEENAIIIEKEIGENNIVSN